MSATLEERRAGGARRRAELLTCVTALRDAIERMSDDVGPNSLSRNVRTALDQLLDALPSYVLVEAVKRRL